MSWFQKEIRINSKPRGFHKITREVEDQIPELKKYAVGIAHIFLKHTSASLTINENADPDVRLDMESYFNKIIPENAPYFRHTTEGSEDMPAHIKSSILGCSLTIPIKNGRFNLGTWQGIYLCEHRNYGGARGIVITITGEET